MTEYIYSGPMQGLTLHDPGGVLLWEGMLHPGRRVALPDHPHVATLTAQDWLAPAPAKAAKAGKTTTSETEI